MRGDMGEEHTKEPAGRSYRDLDVWQVSMDLAEATHRATRGFPKEELFGLTSQIRRAAGSIPANIAEGYGRESDADFARFLRIAQGSLKELETHLLLSGRLELLRAADQESLLALCERVGRMLFRFTRALQKDDR